MMPKLITLGPNQHVVIIKNERFYFSYETCVAYLNQETNVEIRRAEKFSATTSRHLKNMNVDHFRPIGHEDFMHIIGTEQTV